MSDPHPDARSDAALVAAHLGGDRGALAGIYDRYADSLYDTAAAMLRDRHEAADVTQDVFLVAAQRLDQLRDPTRLKPWMFAILRNEVYRRTKRRGRTLATDFSAPEATEMAAPVDPTSEGEAVVVAELADLVRDAAAGLDERDQLVLELSARQGLTGADLADALGVSTDQSYVLLHRMRERVERSLGALTVARAGRRDCPELAKVLGGWDGTFSVLVRKRVARHVDACQVCDRTKRTYAVIPLMGAAPALAAPPELRELVLGRAAAAGAPAPGYGFDEPGGFPQPIDARHRMKWLGLAAVVVLVVLLIGGLVLVAGGDDAAAPAPGADARTADLVVSTESTSPIPSSAATTSSSPVGAPTSTPTSTTSMSPATTTTTATTAVPTSTAAAVAPPVTTRTTSPPTTRSPTTTAAPVATVAPTTVPATTAPPVTTAAPRPGQLDLVRTTVDFGASATAGSVTISNSGELPLTWNVTPNGDVSPFSVSTPGGELAAGASAQVQFSMNRGGLPEGDYVRGFSVTSSASGGGQVQTVGRSEVRPIVTLIAPPTVIACPRPAIRAQVVDSSALASVVLSWSGDSSGSVAIAAVAGEWQGRMPAVTMGFVTYSVTATDVRGNSATSAPASATVVAC